MAESAQGATARPVVLDTDVLIWYFRGSGKAAHPIPVVGAAFLAATSAEGHRSDEAGVVSRPIRLASPRGRHYAPATVGSGAGVQVRYPQAAGAVLSVREPAPPNAHQPRLLDRVRDAIRARHYSRRTEKTYVGWIRRYIFFHGRRHPVELGAAEITAFLTALAVQGHVAASTQNQALSALLFLYRDVLEQELP